MSNFTNSKSLKTLVIWGAAVLAVIIAFISGYGFINNVHNEGVQKTAALQAQYKDNQNELSSYILSFNESLGIADRQSSKLNEIITDAVKGRYDGDSSLEPGNNGAMFSAIAEAYPDLTASSESYAKVQDLVVSGRDAYKNKQSKLLDMLRDYDTWKSTGLIKKNVVTMLGFPGDYLTVTDNGKTYSGAEALERIRNIVLTQEAVDIYDTGIQAPLIVPESDD